MTILLIDVPQNVLCNTIHSPALDTFLGRELASGLVLSEDASRVVWAAVARACQLMTINADYHEVRTTTENILLHLN